MPLSKRRKKFRVRVERYFTELTEVPGTGAEALQDSRVCLNFISSALERLERNEAIRGRSFHSNLFSGVCVHSNYKKKKLE